MTLRMMTGWLCLFGVVLLARPTALPAASSEGISLGPAVTRQDAGLVITARSSVPLPIEGSGSTGQPLFLAPDKADLFLNVDVRGAKGNKNGFGAGEFIPYLSIMYSVLRQGSGQPQQGQLHPLVTPEGLRYGNNLKLAGPGTYSLTVTFEPPIKVGFGRHTDLETGVARWWRPVQVEWTLPYPLPAK
jgi:uncharacterized protein involved in high-affinity Fe2+ transport